MVGLAPAFDDGIVYVRLYRLPQTVSEDEVNQPLEGSPGVLEAEGHDLVAEFALGGHEPSPSRLPGSSAPGYTRSRHQES